jgi:hypothetical protein
MTLPSHSSFPFVPIHVPTGGAECEQQQQQHQQHHPALSSAQAATAFAAARQRALCAHAHAHAARQARHARHAWHAWHAGAAAAAAAGGGGGKQYHYNSHKDCSNGTSQPTTNQPTTTNYPTTTATHGSTTPPKKGRGADQVPPTVPTKPFGNKFQNHSVTSLVLSLDRFPKCGYVHLLPVHSR